MHCDELSALELLLLSDVEEDCARAGRAAGRRLSGMGWEADGWKAEHEAGAAHRLRRISRRRRI